MIRVYSYQVADTIDIKSFKNDFTAQLYYSDADELFYKMDNDQYVYIFKYGVVCFLGFDELKITEFVKFISQYCKNLATNKLWEEFIIETGTEETLIGYNKIEVTEITPEICRIIMLNVSQSVALDYYSQLSGIILEETNHHTQHLEKTGRLEISGRNLQKYIGKTLNLKNRIVENLYIFDSPPETWEDENLNKIDTGMKKTFDIRPRYMDIREELEIIKENLELFKDIMQHRQSNFLEYIIIVLILVEVINLFIEKIFK